MGKNNRARRAAKVKARSRAHVRQGAGSADWGPGRASGEASSRSGPGTASGWRPTAGRDPNLAMADAARSLLVQAAHSGSQGARFASGDHRRLAAMPPEIVDHEAEAVLLIGVNSAWSDGWQPSELVRQGRRGCSTAPAGRLVALAVASDHAGRRSASLDRRWIAQVEGIGLPPANGRPGWVDRWAKQERLDRTPAVDAIVDAIATLLDLPHLEPLLPRPGRNGSPPDATGFPTDDGAEADPVLARIRNLLAKAESTTFEAEATAFTAKAQELMTRHAIDSAVVEGRGGSRAGRTNSRPISVRVPIDAPYADVKSLLLQTVAEAGRCRSVFMPSVAMSTVVGFADDLAGVELLFTSLLLQAQTALADAARRAPAGTRTRSQSFRSAFLVAYTGRIGDRLREMNEAVLAEAEAAQGSAFLPVLRSRQSDVDDMVSERFADTVHSRVRQGYDHAGWASGRAAADRAKLNSGDLTPSGP